MTRIKELWDYLDENRSKALISDETAAMARRIWDDLNAATASSLSVPDACPGLEGDFLYTWEHADHHFEIEIQPGSSPTLFYLNRKSGETWEGDFEMGSPLPTDVLQKLQLFTSRP